MRNLMKQVSKITEHDFFIAIDDSKEFWESVGECVCACMSACVHE